MCPCPLACPPIQVEYGNRLWVQLMNLYSTLIFIRNITPNVWQTKVSEAGANADFNISTGNNLREKKVDKDCMLTVTNLMLNLPRTFFFSTSRRARTLNIERSGRARLKIRRETRIPVRILVSSTALVWTILFLISSKLLIPINNLLHPFVPLS